MILEVSRGSIKVALAGKTVTVPGEMFFPAGDKIGFAISSNQIKHWDYPNQDVDLTEREIADVIDDIRADFELGGHTLEIE
ncbi:hypothetical protein H3H36_18700 [Duganella sp. FT3S]|uniref:Immunity protein 74 n=1 Tax=Rugamonas fusca TaxID=2758568 RepID=A0A7W2EKF4_9BURK|nr:Imm74 family immunity protein [Rugamonas fusca]MBA5607390.1 hypothetical protein [Rugamonas fusca]